MPQAHHPQVLAVGQVKQLVGPGAPFRGALQAGRAGEVDAFLTASAYQVAGVWMVDIVVRDALGDPIAVEAQGKEFRETFTSREYGAIIRYLWTITLLVYIQSPLISRITGRYKPR